MPTPANLRPLDATTTARTGARRVTRWLRRAVVLTLVIAAGSALLGTGARAQPAPVPEPPGPQTCQIGDALGCFPTATPSFPGLGPNWPGRPALPSSTPVPGSAPGCPDGRPICLPTLVPSPAPPAPTPPSPAPPSPAPPSPQPAPCQGMGCVPDPGVQAPLAPAVPGAPPGDKGACSITDIPACVAEAINAFFRDLVVGALNALLDLLTNTLLTTPTPDTWPALAALWESSWQILLASYVMLVLAAGIIVMGYETVQTRYSAKELAPRVVLGFLAGALSLWMATRAIEIANGFALGVLGDGLDPDAAGTALREIILGSLGDGGIFIVLLGLVFVAMLVALLVGYVIRVALTVILIAAAPLALMFHALPQTEHIARWWWKAFGGCLAIQIVQSLTLITAMRVFLTPGGFTALGPNQDGLAAMIVAGALVYILFKIPFWVLSSVRVGGGGRSLVGSLIRGAIAYKTFGLLGGRGGHSRQSGPGRGRRPRSPADGPARPSPDEDPYARTPVTRDGQYLLPLTGLRRVRRPSNALRPTPHQPAPPRHAGQLTLPLNDDWPENKPILQRDGQYRLPIAVTRVNPPRPPGAASRPAAPRAGRARGGRQLELPFDPYQGIRPGPGGQYRLPLGPLPRETLPRAPRPPAPPPPPPRRRTGSGQLELPFDPYKGSRPGPGGQYALPLGPLKRAPREPTPATPTPNTPPPPAPRAVQLRLPLDLPKTPRPAPAPTPPARAKQKPAQKPARKPAATPARRPPSGGTP